MSQKQAEPAFTSANACKTLHFLLTQQSPQIFRI